MNKKIFVFDMDGTLLNNQGDIHPDNVKALQQARAKGHLVVLCSGRSYYDMVEFHEKYKIVDYFVCNNGAYWTDNNKEKINFNHKISFDVAKNIFDNLENVFAINAIHTDQGSFRTVLGPECHESEHPVWLSKAVNEEKSIFPETYCSLEKSLEQAKQANIFQIAFRLNKENVSNSKKILENLRSKFSQYNLNFFFSSEEYIDINPKNVNKFIGLENLCNSLNISTQNIVAFGDSGNDLEMIKNSGYGVAMGNATNEVKSFAKEVIDNHNTNAISQKMSSLI